MDLYIGQSYTKWPKMERVLLSLGESSPLDFRKISVIFSSCNSLHSFQYALNKRIKDDTLCLASDEAQERTPATHFYAIIDMLYQQMLKSYVAFLKGSYKKIEVLVRISTRISCSPSYIAVSNSNSGDRRTSRSWQEPISLSLPPKRLRLHCESRCQRFPK